MLQFFAATGAKFDALPLHEAFCDEPHLVLGNVAALVALFTL
jgi:hypothetical protein